MKKLFLVFILTLLCTTAFAQNREEITNALQGEWLLVKIQIGDLIVNTNDYDFFSEVTYRFQGNNVIELIKHPLDDIDEKINEGTFVIAAEYIILFYRRGTEAFIYDLQGDTLILSNFVGGSTFIRR